MFVIDAHPFPDHTPARTALVDGLGRLKRAYGTPSIVVFDGPPSAGLPHGVRREGIRVLYAAADTGARAQIIELVEREGRRVMVTVVTRDPVLAERARARGARTSPPHLLVEALAQVGVIGTNFGGMPLRCRKPGLARAGAPRAQHLKVPSFRVGCAPASGRPGEVTEWPKVPAC